jgi:WD40 repeat protein
LVLGLLTTNVAQDGITGTLLRTRRAQDRFFTLGIGVAEMSFLGRFLHWLGVSDTAELESRSEKWAIPGIVLVSALAAVLVNGDRLVGVEQALRLPASARIVDSGDINGIVLDADHRYLYATGHSLERIRRYDLRDPSAKPVEAQIPTGSAQGIEYVPEDREIYVYDEHQRMVKVLDEGLALKRSLAVSDLSAGDPWMIVDRASNTITIASEADEQKGVPLLVMDRLSGKVLDGRREEAGNLLLHPRKSVVFLSFFRRTSGIYAYDLTKRDIVFRANTEQRIDRMTVLPKANEVLAASPMTSRILRFDADTLAPKGHYDSIFGVRVMALDEKRNWLLSGSLANGKVSVLDLATGEEIDSFYLGPWLRTIAVVPETGKAYVSSNGLLYEVTYATRDR